MSYILRGGNDAIFVTTYREGRPAASVLHETGGVDEAKRDAMNLEELRVTLARVDKSSWCSSGHAGASVRWLPLVNISESGLWLGLEQEGEWILGRKHGSIVPSKIGRPLPQPWLTLLDISETDFERRLDDAARQFRLPSAFLQARVPVDDVIALGLGSHSSHWAECATRWLVGRRLREDHIVLLRETLSSRWATQWTRQTASRLVAAEAP